MELRQIARRRRDWRTTHPAGENWHGAASQLIAHIGCRSRRTTSPSWTSRRSQLSNESPRTIDLGEWSLLPSGPHRQRANRQPIPTRQLVIVHRLSGTKFRQV